MITHRFFLTAMLVVLISLGAHAQQGNGIRGKLRNSFGVNMSQVIVSIETGNGSPFAQTVTSSEGDFFFGGLTETSYVVVISAPDYNPIVEHVDFVNRGGPDHPGETRTIDITLTRISRAGSPRAGLNFVQNVPKLARDAFDLAVKEARAGKDQEALAALLEAIRIFPDYFDAHFLLGREFIKQAKYSDAIKQLDEARRINPKDDRVYHSFGAILMQQGKYAVAAAVFAEAFRLNPLDPENPLLRGKALLSHASSIDSSQSEDATIARNSALSDAEKSITQAYELSGKKLATAHLLLASVYEKRGERARAADQLELYLRQTPDANNEVKIRDAIKKLRTPAGSP